MERPLAVLALLGAHFSLFGVIIGAQGVLWAELVSALRLSKSIFGAVQLVSPLLSVALLLAGGQLANWASKKRLALASLVVLASSNLALAGADGLLGLAGALLLAGAGNALLEMSMNGATLDWEQATGRSVMNLMHAGFSGGAVLGAFAAGLLLGGGWSYGAVLFLLALLCSLALAIVAFILLGLAVAGVVPTVLSAAARFAPGNTAALTGGIMAAAYSGFIICPPLTGWIADQFSLQAALITVGFSGLAMIWLAWRVK